MLVYVCTCVLCPERPEDGVIAPGGAIKIGCKPLNTVLRGKLYVLQEQQVLLTT